MGQIRILPTGLVNRIAAGECVERPASVVKELVENALDAGAGRIDVQIEEGGRGLIQVVDDGSGMELDDLKMCVQPHATSKIAADDDLFNIHTMGFRGEALPSIGSVSRLEITTRPAGSDVAHRIAVEGGELTAPKPCAAAPGTSVVVRDLFFNVPARRKFLRTAQTEMSHITEQFARIALAHAGIGFSLRHHNRTMQQLPPAPDRRKRIGDFYGHELAEVLLPVRREGEGILIEGWVAPPKESRGSNKWEYVFVNGRYVKDRFVSHAIKEAYRSLIDPSRYPVTFIFITIAPDQVDVNVHPTKIELRWRDSNYIHGQMLATLREKFLSTNLDHSLRIPAQDADDDYRARAREALTKFFTQPQQRTLRTAEDYARIGGGSASAPTVATTDQIANPNTESRPDAPEPAPRDHDAPEATSPTPDERSERVAYDLPAQDSESFTRPLPRFVQLHNTFLVVESEDGLMIIDQHALHERILYEQFRRRIAERPLTAQRLLMPESVAVPAEQIEVLETHAETLQRLGLELTASGPSNVALHAFPALLDRVDRDAFVRDLLDILAERGARPSTESLIHDLLDMMACKAAVKAGDPLTNEEIAALLEQREAAERSSHCPHGRPTTLQFSLRELEKQFKRR